MRHFISPASSAVLFLMAMIFPGCRIAAPEAAAPAALVEPELALPSHYLVRLWRSPGVFEKAKFASVQGDTLYVSGTIRGIEALDTATGLTRWMHTGQYVIDADVSVFGNTVIYPEGGRFVVLDRTNGEELFRSKTRLGIMSPIYPSESNWIFASGSDQIYSVTPTTGIKNWHFEADEAPISSTSNGNGLVYFVTVKGTIEAISATERNLAWEYTFRRPLCSPPVVEGDLLFIGNQDFYLYALNAHNGQLLWRVPVSAQALDAPVAARGRVYVQTVDGVLHAIDIATQKELWTVERGGHVLTTTADVVIYVRPEPAGNEIVVASAADGKTLTTATAVRYTMFRADPDSGVFFAIARNGEVLAIADRATAEAREAAKVEKP